MREKNDDSHEPPPGPADHGREGGMATRENAPELTGDRSSED